MALGEVRIEAGIPSSDLDPRFHGGVSGKCDTRATGALIFDRRGPVLSAGAAPVHRARRGCQNHSRLFEGQAGQICGLHVSHQAQPALQLLPGQRRDARFARDPRAMATIDGLLNLVDYRIAAQGNARCAEYRRRRQYQAKEQDSLHRGFLTSRAESLPARRSVWE